MGFTPRVIEGGLHNTPKEPKTTEKSPKINPLILALQERIAEVIGEHWKIFFQILNIAENQRINEESVQDFINQYHDWDFDTISNFIKNVKNLETLKTKPSLVIALRRLAERYEIDLGGPKK